MSRGPEGKLQDKIVRYLKKNGWLVVKINLCSLNGFPDLFLLKYGISIHVEVKAPGKQPEDLQLYAHKQITGHGGKVIVANNFEQFKKDFLSSLQ